jgi:hypothetical protein
MLPKVCSSCRSNSLKVTIYVVPASVSIEAHLPSWSGLEYPYYLKPLPVNKHSFEPRTSSEYHKHRFETAKAVATILAVPLAIIREEPASSIFQAGESSEPYISIYTWTRAVSFSLKMTRDHIQPVFQAHLYHHYHEWSSRKRQNHLILCSKSRARSSSITSSASIHLRNVSI